MLGGSAAVLVPVLVTATGCSRVKPAEVPPPGPEVAILDGAIRDEAGLIALYDAAIAAHPGLADRLRPLRDHHVRHLSVLKRHYVPGTATGTTTPAPNTAASAPTRQPGLAALQSAERRAAAARADEVRRTTMPGLAQLLASIGACEAGHAQELV